MYPFGRRARNDDIRSPAFSPEVTKEGVSLVTWARMLHHTNCRSPPPRSDRVCHDQCGFCHPINGAIRRFSASHRGCRWARRSTTPPRDVRIGLRAQGCPSLATKRPGHNLRRSHRPRAFRAAKMADPCRRIECARQSLLTLVAVLATCPRSIRPELPHEFVQQNPSRGDLRTTVALSVIGRCILETQISTPPCDSLHMPDTAVDFGPADIRFDEG